MRVTRSDVHIEAPREAVWRVLTEPDYVKQWQYGSVLETDWTIGSPIRFTSTWDGQTFEQWGTVLAVASPSELRYSLFAPRPELEDKPENYFTMTYSLRVDAAGTALVITQEDPREEGPAPEAGDSGDNPVLAALKGLAESVAAGRD
jgi:uncharacterized protein YndB with AHSA1/START domain